MDAVDTVRLAAMAIGLVGLVVALVGALRSRGERPVAPLSLALGVTGIVLSATLAVLLPPISFTTPVLWALVVGGGLAGLLAASTVGIRLDPRGVLVRGGAWHLIPAALALVGLQVAAWVGTIDGVVLATAATVACAAFVAAATALTLTRGFVARPRVESITVVSVAASASRSGGPPPAWGPSAAPAARPTAGTATAVPVGTTCGACGSPVRTGWRHCVTCGTALAWESRG